ncbi:hypothetical protein PG993_009110 [Apiospora rasikravindrae]|uniref:BTB domain-containing protein n=1 Tax=Apiospora rasikravindrae TaxID=990691 RepID=A0ABR1SK83_9PEZI
MRERHNEDEHAQDELSQTSSNKDGPIHLQVGEYNFTTWEKTLTDESAFFAAMFSSRRKNYTTPNGVVYLDADGWVFKDVLAYLRTGNFPLFFDAATNSFDYARYQNLLGEAKDFEIRRLEQWIEQQRYLDAVEVLHQKCTFDNEEELAQGVIRAAGNIVVSSSGWGT